MFKLLLADFNFELVFFLEDVLDLRVGDGDGVDPVHGGYDITFAKAGLFGLASRIDLKTNKCYITNCNKGKSS